MGVHGKAKVEIRDSMRRHSNGHTSRLQLSSVKCMIACTENLPNIDFSRRNSDIIITKIVGR